MIFYFSGTGNSQLAAIRIAQITNEPLISINQSLKTGKQKAFQSKGPLVFVTPTYAWRMPKVVTQWIESASFTGNPDAYFIMTCAGSCGNAAAYIKKLCTKKGLRFCGLAPVIMPENYIAMFQAPNKRECQQIIERAKLQMDAIANQIKAGQLLPLPHASFSGRFKSGPVNPLFYTFYVHDKGFTVSDKCISCGTCARRCPLNNIAIKHSKPVWQGDCTHCMACINSCPLKAIEYRSKSKGQHRHDIMIDIPLEEKEETLH